MFDQYLIRKDSLQNVTERGVTTGFKFAVRIADYRGCFLSLHNGYYIACDGVEYPKALQRFEINGKAPRSFDEIRTAVWEHWDFDDEGWVYVEKPSGLTPGVHEIALQQSVLEPVWLLSPRRGMGQESAGAGFRRGRGQDGRNL